jgi:PHP family Zn ribbon phosphoesterase
MPVEFRGDLHIHTCLSPCADLSMTPRAIVGKAASLGINIIAVCDHNSAENVGVTRDLAREKGINVIPGIEICSSEEVHVLGLFGDLEGVMKMQDVVYDNLQPGENDEDRFGMQVVVNEIDEVMDFNRRLLIGATGLSVNRVVELIHEFGGIAIASHIDREGFGIIGQLGFIPPEIEFDALEISRRISIDEALRTFSGYRRFPWVTSSDAHLLDEIGTRTTGLLMYHSTFDEMRLALKGIAERGVIL